ncbi:hypothetical protein VitviT2T_000580 [Vitis vinifera]|uniref:Tryptophan synthase beta chain-like PALP domain-containing protein n=1 Tax=Vitis vinifera TaxID=29760 RepID=A0ABY9BD21_VITVI|nr:D-cysteine desulfhydrase 2, mitochondrial isoform X1 [Vitis vinifera]WJZ80680.1 hypothetical protein VitviT2T_000580 [Vitis vinifera]|eukprot:XP_002282104.1 PREDICTED: D-cysteine desulfhydrase 2, mitochondrial isoform X1 [Vitis vinifera]
MVSIAVPLLNMKLHRLPRHPPLSSLGNDFRSTTSQGVSELKLCGEEFVTKLLDRRWTLLNPNTTIHQIKLSTMLHGNGLLGNISFSSDTHPSLGHGTADNCNQDPSFYVVRDDLLHPLVNGNKARKLDGLLPLVEDHSVTDVVSCGGCQSAHAAAVAVSCAERGLKSHLLLRGERPEILTGYNLISTLYGNVKYVPRSLYAKREEMLTRHADLVAGNSGSVVWFNDLLETSFTTQTSGKPNLVQIDAHMNADSHPRKVAIINEGAADAVGLLGMIRLVQYLSQNHLFGKERTLKIVVDAGTGTTAVGLGLGALCLGLSWEVTGVMLADTVDGYRKKEKCLISDFKHCTAFHHIDHVLKGMDGGIVHWVERDHPRKFGNVKKGEVEACQQIAQQTGILVDPIYTLAAWELATLLSQEEAKGGAKVVMLHTGGTLGMFGLAQRYKSYFHAVKDGLLV